MATRAKPGEITDRMFTRDLEGFLFFLREIIIKGNCTTYSAGENQRTLSYAKSRLYAFFEGYIKKQTNKGYRFHFAPSVQTKGRLHDARMLFPIPPQKMGAYITLFRSLALRPRTIAELLTEWHSDMHPNSLRQYLNAMCDAGVCTNDSLRGAKRYQLSQSLFHGLRGAQSGEVLSLLEFAQATAWRSFEYHALQKVLQNEHPQARPAYAMQYRHMLLHTAIDEPALQTCMDALAQQKMLKISYYFASSPEAETLEAAPLRIVRDTPHGRQYLFCYQPAADRILTLRCSNIRSVSMLAKEYDAAYIAQLPCVRDFHESIPAAWTVSYSGECREVQLKFRKTHATLYRVQNEGRHGRITTQDEGFFFYAVLVPDWLEMKSWILSFGADCEALSPPELRENIIQTYEDIIYA